MANIYRACKNKKIARLIKIYNINVDLYFKMYLWQAAVNNIKIFQEEKKVSIKHQWLLQGYKTALNEMQVYVTKEIMRKVFIQEFNAEIKKTAHAFLNFTEGSFNNLPLSSDLDILVLKDDIPGMTRFCEKHLSTSKIKVYTKSFMTTIELYFKDNTFLSLDLIHQFKRKGIELLDTKPLLISAMPNSEGIMVPDVKFDFEYCLLFYALNGANMPMKYQEHYNLQNLLQKNKIHNYINKKYKLKYYNYYEMFDFSAYLKMSLLAKLERLDFNLHFKKIKNKLNYVLDTLRDMIYRKGLIITFSGVEGAGKTTIIERVKARLKSKYRKEVVSLRHRPGILPILSALKYGKEEAEHIASVTLPREGKNNNVLSSILRFSYYFTDYMIGQVYVYFKYVLRGKIVLYDRYYFDFINDPKRSHIQLNRSFLKALYSLVFKPKLNFFLYADAATIRARKNEMMAPEIDQLTVLYKQLFGQMSEQYTNSHYTIIENKELDVTLNEIMKSYAKLA
jgi:thymidylate kinase